MRKEGLALAVAADAHSLQALLQTLPRAVQVADPACKHDVAGAETEIYRSEVVNGPSVGLRSTLMEGRWGEEGGGRREGGGGRATCSL
jgi:hypothetical protein